MAERAELPLSAVRDGDGLLSDLHLNSITVSELLLEATRQLGLSPSATPTDYAEATLAQVAEALEERIRIEGSASAQETEPSPSGVDTWIRPFTMALVERVRPRPRPATAGVWKILAPPGYPLKAALQKTFEHAGGGGIVVGLPSDPEEQHIRLLLEGARAVMAEGAPRCFVRIQHGGGAASFARTLHLEAPTVTVCVVDVPVDHPEALAWVLAEAQAAAGYTEAHYDTAGVRREPRLRLLDLDEPPAEVLPGPDDVLLITGGGKGITAECAFAIGCETGACLVLMGRSRPADDAELAATLERMTGAGLRFHYVRADVTDAEAVRVAVAAAEARFGPVTGILHGAARNVPQRLSTLDEAAFSQTLAPKVQGLRNVLDAVDPERLRLLLTFGSIIARMGLPGEAHYAVANEWLRRLTERWQQAHPRCRCLAIEWSVWSGVGMGARLGSVEALLHRDITPISPEEGLLMLRRLLAQPPAAAAVVVTGRFGDLPTLQIEQPELPFLRFLEHPRRYVPGVELIVDARLSSDTDPYLDDHQLQEQRLLPAVMGLEAMAQAATALTGISGKPVFEDVSFLRPVVVPDDAPLTIRVAALVREPGRVEVVLRSEQTAFQTDHFRATCRFEAPPATLPSPLAAGLLSSLHSVVRRRQPDSPPGSCLRRNDQEGIQGWSMKKAENTPQVLDFLQSGRSTTPAPPRSFLGSPAKAGGRQEPGGELESPRRGELNSPALLAAINGAAPVALDPEQDLYGGLLFHEGRFRRVRGYRMLRATACVAEVAPAGDVSWFSRYLPADLVLGDPGARDAAIHAIQACIPHATLIPVGIDRLLPGVAPSSKPCFVHAWERSRDGDTFIYDVAVTDAEGRVLEQWEGLRLHLVGQRFNPKAWPAPLLGPYLERRIQELIAEADVSVAVLQDATVARRARSDRAMQQALGVEVPIERRSNGKPEAVDAGSVSAAHAGDLTLAVSGAGPLGCDVEPVAARPEAMWRDLLGPERYDLALLIARETEDDLDTAATRVWTALECLKKASATPTAPLRLDASFADGWIVLATGALCTATFVTSIRGMEGQLVCAVLTRSRPVHQLCPVLCLDARNTTNGTNGTGVPRILRINRTP